MKQFKINLINSEDVSSEPKFQTKATLMVATIFVFVVSFLAGRYTYSAAGDSPTDIKDVFSLVMSVGKLILSPDKKLLGEDTDRINILMLGMAGENHDGPLLTDTMIVASIKPSQNKVALLSIPRDLLVPVGPEEWRKVNAINALTEKTPGAGLEATRSSLSALLGLEIPYAIRVDFSGFETFIDSIGGLDVFVDKQFTDPAYPTENYSFKTVTFTNGWVHLDGQTALEFVRSRHGNNGEGSDFARSRRQQKILTALKEKLLTVNLLTNPTLIRSLLAVLQSNVTTNLQFGEIARLAKLGQSIDRSQVNSVVLDDGANSPLRSGSFSGAYVLLPKSGDWSDLRYVASNIFDRALDSSSLESPPPNLILTNNFKRATVEIQNIPATTTKTKIIAAKLAQVGFDVVRISNANRDDYQATTIYVLDNSGRIAMSKIRAVFPEATVVTKPTQQTLTKFGLTKDPPQNNPDLLVILGQDQNS